MKAKSLSRVRFFATPWTRAYQAPPSMGFSRQEYWSRVPFPSSGDLPDPRIELALLTSPAVAGRFFTTSATWVLVLISTVQRKWFCYTYIFFSLGIPWVGKIPWRRKWQHTPVFMPGKSHGLRSLVSYSPWSRKELHTTERLLFFFF